MIRRPFALIGFGLTTLLIAASPVLADEADKPAESDQPASACSLKADFVFPSITVTPWANVAVGAQSEFKVEEKEDGVVAVTHVGDAEVVRFPSLVAVGKTLELTLTNPATRYCIISSVATLGGTIKLIGDAERISFISTVGDVQL